ncbi:MAG: Ig-like domain-containing protein [Gammaproteobacteria bacterium]
MVVQLSSPGVEYTEEAGGVPTVIDSEPPDGAREVDGKALISVRFSKPLRVTSLNAKTIALVGPEGHVPVTITPTEGGLVVFVLPKEELLPSSDYALIVQGATDRERQALPFTAIGFNTRAFEPIDGASPTGGPRHSSPGPVNPGPGGGHDPTGDSPTGADRGGPTGQAATEATRAANQKALTQAETEDGESFVLGPEQRRGHWRTGRRLPDAVVALRDLQAPHRKRIENMRARMHRDKDGRLAPAKRKGLVDDPAVTGVGGTVLRLNDRPLAGVTVSIDKHSVHTDRHGRFELTGITPGHHKVVVDGRTGRGKEYLEVVLGVEVRAHGLTSLPMPCTSRACVLRTGSTWRHRRFRIVLSHGRMCRDWKCTSRRRRCSGIERGRS